MDKTRQPGISFDGIILVKEDFWRDHNVPEGELNIQLGIHMTYGPFDPEQNTAEMEIDLKVMHNDNAVVKIVTKFVGLFSVIPDKENMDIQEFLENNAPALMYPYVREHISAITTKAGIKTVILPPLNVRALLIQGSATP